MRRRPSVESALAGLRNSRKMISAMNAMATTVPTPKGQLAGDQTADLINDGGYNVCVCAHVADRQCSPLAVVHLTLDSAHCCEARCAQQVECHERIRADLSEVPSQLAPDLGAVLGNLTSEVVKLTEGSDNVLLCNQTGDGGNGGFPCTEARQRKDRSNHRADARP